MSWRQEVTFLVAELPGTAPRHSVPRHLSVLSSPRWTQCSREDQRRVRKDHGPQNINTLRQIGHNLLKSERTLKVGIQRNRLNAGWDENYLLKVILG